MKKYTLFMILITILIIPSLVFAIEFSDRTFLKFKKGMVRVKRFNGGWVRASNNMDLNIGDSIKTLSNGRATVVLSGTAFLKVKPNSTLTIPKDKANSPEKVSFVKLAKGVLWAHAKKEKNSLKVATPHAICGVRGTEFIVQAGRDFMRLIVTKGAVAFVPTLKGVMPTAKLVSAGQQIFFKPSVAKKKAEDKKKSKKKEKKKEEKAKKVNTKQPAKAKEEPAATKEPAKTEEPTMEKDQTSPAKSATDVFNNAVDDMMQQSGIEPDSSFEDAASQIEQTASDNSGISVQNMDTSATDMANSLGANFESTNTVDPTDSIQQVTDYVSDVIDNTASDAQAETTPDTTVNTAVEYGQVKVSW